MFLSGVLSMFCKWNIYVNAILSFICTNAPAPYWCPFIIPICISHVFCFDISLYINSLDNLCFPCYSADMEPIPHVYALPPNKTSPQIYETNSFFMHSCWTSALIAIVLDLWYTCPYRQLPVNSDIIICPIRTLASLLTACNSELRRLCPQYHLPVCHQPSSVTNHSLIWYNIYTTVSRKWISKTYLAISSFP